MEHSLGLAPFVKQYQVIRSNRKSVGFHVQKDGALIVRVPFLISRKNLESIVKEYSGWIERARQRVLSRPQALPKQFQEGERFWWMGEKIDLKILDHAEKPFYFFGGTFFLWKTFQSRAKPLMTKWYREQAQSYLPDRVKYFAAKAGFAAPSVSINQAKSRWGSCSSRGKINLSWRVMMAPMDVIDYIVAHEVAHLRYQNHARGFWNFVAELTPHYRSSVQWLKQHEWEMEF